MGHGSWIMDEKASHIFIFSLNAEAKTSNSLNAIARAIYEAHS